VTAGQGQASDIDQRFAEAERKRIDMLKLDAVAKLSTPWCLHDLRRTCASGMARLGVAPHVVEAVLNHKSGQVRGVAAVYNRYSYAAEKAAALDLWAEHVERCAGQYHCGAAGRGGR
jgi:integrase